MNFQVVRTYLFGFMPCILIETFGSRCTGSLLQLLLAMPRCHGLQKLRTTCTAWASRRIKSWGLNGALSSCRLQSESNFQPPKMDDLLLKINKNG